MDYEKDRATWTAGDLTPPGGLSLTEREEISRELAADTSIYTMAVQLGRAHAVMQALREFVNVHQITVLIFEQNPTLPLAYCDLVIGMVTGRTSASQPSS